MKKLTRTLLVPLVFAASLLAFESKSASVSPIDEALINRNKAGVFEQLRLLGSPQAEKDRLFSYGVRLGNMKTHPEISDLYLDIASALLADGASMYSDVALLIPIAAQNPRLIEFLYRNKFNLNTPDKLGKTLVHWAVLQHSPESLKTLIKLGANLEVKDEDQVTPLGQAIYVWAGGGRFDNAELKMKAEVDARELVKGGADVNKKFTARDRSPLHEAARFNREDIVRFLISAGANASVRDADGTTIEAELIEGQNREVQKENEKQRKLAEAKGGLFSRETLMGVVAIAGATAANYAAQTNQKNLQSSAAALPLAQVGAAAASKSSRGLATESKIASVNRAQARSADAIALSATQTSKGPECGAMGNACPVGGSNVTQVPAGYKDARTENWERELARPKYASKDGTHVSSEASESAARASALEIWEATRNEIEDNHKNHVQYGRILSVGSPQCRPQRGGATREQPEGQILKWSCGVAYTVERARQPQNSGGTISR